MLEPLGFELREATTGTEAVEVFGEWHPHLVFMDRRLPAMDGLEATRRIRALPGGEAPAIVAVSAHSFTNEQQEMLDAGCCDFLAKPFKHDDLMAMLEKHLGLERDISSATQTEEAGPLSADDLRSLPRPLLAELYRLALDGDHSGMEKWMESHEALDPVAKQGLLRLMKEFRYDRLQEVLEPLVQSEGSRP